jgi:oxygen-independent coproporphyrinogen-3 oxidase
VDDELACAMYEELVTRSAAHEFGQYEIANFARQQRGPGVPSAGRNPGREEIPDRACRHNINYWRGGSYCGLGPSAAGYVGGVRTKNWSNTTLYCEQLERGQRAIESREELSALRRAGETAAFGLRMTAGWPFAEFERTTGFDLRHEWQTEIGQLVARQWGQADADRFQLTSQGLRFADAAAELFLR